MADREVFSHGHHFDALWEPTSVTQLLKSYHPRRKSIYFTGIFLVERICTFYGNLDMNDTTSNWIEHIKHFFVLSKWLPFRHCCPWNKTFVLKVQFIQCWWKKIELISAFLWKEQWSYHYAFDINWQTELVPAGVSTKRTSSIFSFKNN